MGLFGVHRGPLYWQPALQNEATTDDALGRMIAALSDRELLELIYRMLRRLDMRD